MRRVAHYIVGNGLGNIIATTPAFNYLKKKYEKVVVATTPQWEEFVRAVYAGHTIYIGSVRGFTNVFRSCSPHDFIEGGTQSEVERNLELVGCKAPGVEDKQGFCGYDDSPEAKRSEGYILLCNGYNSRKNLTDWHVKTYPHWEGLVEWLFIDGHNTASVGLPIDYIEETDDFTGVGLYETFGLIKNCKLLVSNDTGLYHAACAMGKKCVTMFTMTDRTKNYDPVFHKSADIVHTDLPCQPCQLRSSRTFWLKNRNVCGWKCRDIPVYTVMKTIRGILQ